jgi:hypothetical protein
MTDTDITIRPLREADLGEADRPGSTSSRRGAHQALLDQGYKPSSSS